MLSLCLEWYERVLEGGACNYCHTSLLYDSRHNGERHVTKVRHAVSIKTKPNLGNNIYEQ